MIHRSSAPVIPASLRTRPQTMHHAPWNALLHIAPLGCGHAGLRWWWPYAACFAGNGQRMGEARRR